MSRLDEAMSQLCFSFQQQSCVWFICRRKKMWYWPNCSLIHWCFLRSASNLHRLTSKNQIVISDQQEMTLLNMQIIHFYESWAVDLYDILKTLLLCLTVWLSKGTITLTVCNIWHTFNHPKTVLKGRFQYTQSKDWVFLLTSANCMYTVGVLTVHAGWQSAFFLELQLLTWLVLLSYTFGRSIVGLKSTH